MNILEMLSYLDNETIETMIEEVLKRVTVS